MQLQDNDEADGDEDESQVDEDHEAANSSRVRAERVGSGHGFYHNASLGRVAPGLTGTGSMTSAAFRANIYFIGEHKKNDVE